MTDAAVIVSAAIAATPPTLAVLLTYQRQRRLVTNVSDSATSQLEQIHVLVNDRMEQALNTISRLIERHEGSSAIGDDGS